MHFVSSWTWPLLLLLLSGLCNADEGAFFRDPDYNRGRYGSYVTETFVSSGVRPPRLNMIRSFSRCDDGAFLFVTPRGHRADSSPFILHPSGSLIWAPTEQYGEVYNLEVQEYQGEPCLTFWGGDDSIRGHGEGKWYVLNQQYKQIRTVTAPQNLKPDLHSFTITKGNTAIITIYEHVEVNLDGVYGKSGRGWIWDSLFQELDIDTGRLLFQWRASEHFDLRESYNNMNAATAANPWDFFHINSVAKDNQNHYLISSRHMRCIAYIHGETGEVMWQLGGRSNSFHDLSGGEASKFTGQHDARFADNGTVITLFDNGADWFHATEEQSRGLRVQIDLEAMSVELCATYLHPQKLRSASQGSYQTLPNGNVVLGYGSIAAIAEFAQDGTILCDAYFGPSSEFGAEHVQSYRNLKFNWTGLPDTKPNLVLHDGSLYVSWLGSTEVRKWLFQDSFGNTSDFEEVFRVRKSAFETSLALNMDWSMRRYVQVLALDDDEQVLSMSEVVDIGELANWVADDEELEDYADEGPLEMLGHLQDAHIIVGFVSMSIVVGILLSRWISPKKRRFQRWHRSKLESLLDHLK